MKKNKIMPYFDACVVNAYTLNQKLNHGFLKEASMHFGIPIFVCRLELKKARVRLYNRVAYLKKSEKVKFIAAATNLNKKMVINHILKKDIELTKNGIAKFFRLFNFVFTSSKVSRVQEIENFLNNEEDKKYIWFDIESYLVFLSKEINKLSPEGYVSGAALEDSVFFSTYTLAETINKYSDRYIVVKDRKKILKYIVRKLQEHGMLAEKINCGYYSNTVLIEFNDGKKISNAHGIFIKKSAFNMYFDFDKSKNIESIKQITVSKI